MFSIYFIGCDELKVKERISKGYKKNPRPSKLHNTA
jgi:hypothetical protein